LEYGVAGQQVADRLRAYQPQGVQLGFQPADPGKAGDDRVDRGEAHDNHAIEVGHHHVGLHRAGAVHRVGDEAGGNGAEGGDLRDGGAVAVLGAGDARQRRLLDHPRSFRPWPGAWAARIRRSCKAVTPPGPIVTPTCNRMGFPSKTAGDFLMDMAAPQRGRREGARNGRWRD